MTGPRLVLLALLAFGALVATAPPDAGACSCAYRSDEARYRAADAAVIGTVVAGDEERVTLRVDHEFKTDLPEQIVLPNGESPACGLDLEPGDDEVGLFLHRTTGGGWTASLCDYVDPDRLPGAEQRLPPPAGTGTAALLAYGGFSAGRVAALDAEGRPLAYGAGRGEAVQMSVCPRSRHAVELAVDDDGPLLARRRLRDLRVVHQARPPHARRSVDVTCLDEAGERLLVAVDRRRGDDAVAVLDRGRPRVIWRGRAQRMELDGGFAFVERKARRGLLAVDAETGARWRLRGVRPLTESWTLSPDGTKVAAITPGGEQGGRDEAALVVAELTGARRIVTRDLGLEWLEATVLWLSDDRILFGGDSNFLRLYDAELRQLRRYGTRFTPVRLTLAGGRVYGIGSGLEVAEGPEWAARVLGDLPARGLSELVGIPRGVAIDTTG